MYAIFLQTDEDNRIELTVFDLFTQPWFFTYFDYVQFSTSGNFRNAERYTEWYKYDVLTSFMLFDVLFLDRMSGDLNARTPFSIVSEQNKLGIRFRSSTLFNFRGFKLHYLVTFFSLFNIQNLTSVTYFSYISNNR